MISLVTGNWALLFGITLLMIGHGLQGTLLSLRTALEGFPTELAGLVLSGYFLGLLAGSLSVPHLIARVGHVRVFAAMVSVASTTILFHILVIEPLSWLVLRFATGYCFAGIYIVAESWLNASSGNETRGRLFAVYMALQTLGFSIGPLLLNFADPGGFEPFLYVSVLVSLAVVPMLLTAVPAPTPSPPQRFGLRDLYQTSPFGFVAIVGVGVTLGALNSIGPLFGREIGLSVFAITILMALVALGGALFQWPFGRLSDRMDRRRVMIGASTAAALALALAHLAAAAGHLPLFFLGFFLFAGCSYPLYSLSVAHTNDHLRPDQMVAASSALLLANGIGATLGPTGAAMAMAWAGAAGFVLFLVAINVGIAAFGAYRMVMRPPVPAEERSRYVPLPQATPVALELAQETATEMAEEGQREAREKQDETAPGLL